MKVDYSYLSRQFSNPDAIFSEMKELVSKGDFTLGKHVEAFEEKFANLIGTDYAIGVGSGTDAIFLSLKALGIGDGEGYQKDEVITAANTFVATAGAIETAGAVIKFVDCNEKYVMDVAQVEAAITKNTKAIIPVHYSGQPVQMDALLEIAKKHNLEIVEDACCAIDASFDQKNCGTMGTFGAFSLHPLKNLNIWGDGGVITTQSKDHADKLKLLRNHGMINRDEYAFYAYNSRLDTLQSIVGKHLIKDVKWITDKRIENANKVDQTLKNIGQIVIPPRSARERNVYHMYMLLVERRDELYKYLLDHEIDAKIHYPIPLHLQKASEKLGYQRGDFPVAEKQAETIISLPIHQHLKDEEIDFMTEKVKSFYQS